MNHSLRVRLIVATAILFLADGRVFANQLQSFPRQAVQLSPVSLTRVCDQLLLARPFSWPERLRKVKPTTRVDLLAPILEHLSYLRELAALAQSREGYIFEVAWFADNGNLSVNDSPTEFYAFLKNSAPTESESTFWASLILQEGLTPSSLRRAAFPEPQQTYEDEATALLEDFRYYYDDLLTEFDGAVDPDADQGTDLLEGLLSNMLSGFVSSTSLNQEMLEVLRDTEKFGIEGPLFAGLLEKLDKLDWNLRREAQVLKFFDDLTAGRLPIGKPAPVLVAKLSLAIMHANQSWMSQKDLEKTLLTYLMNSFPLGAVKLGPLRY